MSTQFAPIEVFYSYADADEGLCSELDKHLSQLRHDGLITTLHKQQIVPGTDWNKALDQYLNTASVILLLVSPDFIASDYCYGIEIQQAMKRHEAGETRVIPILLRSVDWQSGPFGKLRSLPSNQEPIAMWGDRDAAFTNVAQGIRATLQDIQHRLIVSTPPTTFPPIGNIPFARSLFFTGREVLLEQLHTQLHISQVAGASHSLAISGLGGIGKTQVAIEYAYRYGGEHQTVLWANADTIETLNKSYTEIATFLQLPQRNAQKQEEIVQAVKDWLESQSGWLFLLDNANELLLIQPFLPRPFGGHLLLTTQEQTLGGLAQPFKIGAMDNETGALLLLRRTRLIASDATLESARPSDRTEAIQITKELGGLPLALDQAGAYIEKTGCSLKNYQRRYQEERKELLNTREDNDKVHPDPVFTTFSLSFGKVKQKNAVAADLLRFCAFLAPDAIPEEFLSKGAEKLGKTLAQITSKLSLLDRAIGDLRAYSLIGRDARASTLSIHPLVQFVVRESLSDEERRRWMQRVVNGVEAACPGLDFAHWPFLEQWLPHAFACATWIEQMAMNTPEAAMLLTQAGNYLQERARYAEAEPLQVQALHICEQLLKDEETSAADAEEALTAVQQWGKEFAKELGQIAGRNQMRVMLSVSVFAAEDPLMVYMRTVICLNNLAELYRAQDKNDQAEGCFQRAFKLLRIQKQRSEKVAAAIEPLEAICLNDLATLYKDQKKYTQAEELHKQALAIREKTYGTDSFEAAESLNNLAVLYSAQERDTEAEPLYKRALEIREQKRGTNHPRTAQSLYNLGYFYLGQGKNDQAEPLLQHALDVTERSMGLDHPDTQAMRATLEKAMKKL